MSVHSSVGLDATTLSRLHLDQDSSETLGQFFLHDTLETSQWHHYLSSSDLADSKNLLSIPLRSGIKLLGLFIVIESPYARLPAEALDMLCKGIGITLGNKIRNSRHSSAVALTIKTSTGTTVQGGPVIRIGDMAKSISRRFIGAHASAIELDVLSILVELCRPYDPVFNKNGHYLELTKSSINADSMRILLQDITFELEGRLFGSDIAHLDLASFVG